MTVLDLITAAVAELNVIDAGATLDASNADFALDRVNDYLDALATEGLTVSQITRATWTLTSGVQTYTIGLGATINVTRPVSPQAIVQIGYQNSTLSPTTEILTSLLTDQEYAAWTPKGLTGAVPSAFYYNPTVGATGYGTITVYPSPTTSLNQGVIYVPTPVTEVADLTVTLALAPGWRRFLRLNLAVEFAGAFQVPVPPGLEERARDAKANIKRVNQRLDDMMTVSGGTYDIWTDRYR